jgi:hypothetical protein
VPSRAGSASAQCGWKSDTRKRSSNALILDRAVERSKVPAMDHFFAETQDHFAAAEAQAIADGPLTQLLIYLADDQRDGQFVSASVATRGLLTVRLRHPDDKPRPIYWNGFRVEYEFAGRQDLFSRSLPSSRPQSSGRVAIAAVNGETGVVHIADVDSGFEHYSGDSPPGLIPRAHALTKCGLDATGFSYCHREQVPPASFRHCQNCVDAAT